MERIVMPIAILGLIAAIAIGLPALDSLVRVRMGILRIRIVEALERSLGCDIRYESISPSFLRALEFRGLSLYEPSGTAFLKVGRLSLFYRLDRLLSGSPEKALTRAEIVGLWMRSDRNSQDGMPALVKRLSSAQGSGGPLSLPERFRLSFRNAAFEWVDGDWKTLVQAADADFLLDGGGMEINCRFPMEIRGPSLPPTKVAALVEGGAEKDFSAFRLTVEASASSRDFSVSRQKILCSYKDGTLALRKVADRSPLDLTAALDLRSGDFKMGLDFVRFKPSALGSVRRGLSGLSAIRDIILTGTGRLEGNTRLPSLGLRYDFKATAVLPSTILPGNAMAEASITGDWKSLGALRLGIESEDGYATWTGSADIVNKRAFGDLDAAFRWRGLDLRGKAALRPTGGGWSHDLFSESFTIGDARVLSLALHVQPEPGKVDLGLEGYIEQEGTLESDQTRKFGSMEAIPSGTPSRFDVTGSWYSGRLSFLELSATLSRIPGEFIIGVVKPFIPVASSAERLAAGYSLNAEAWLSTDFKKLAFSVPEVIVSSRDRPGTYAVASLSGASGNLSLDSLSVFWPGHRFRASLQADYSDQRIVFVDSSLDLDGTGYSLTGTIIDGTRFSFSGAHGLALNGRIDGGQAVFGLSMESFPIPFGEFVPRLSMEASGRFRSIDDWFVEASTSKLEQRSLLLPSYAEIGFSGSFNQEGGKLTSISLKDEYSSLSGSADLAWTLASPFSASINMNIADKAGKESYGLSAAVSGAELWGRLDLASVPIARFTRTTLKGALSGRASLSGTMSSPKVAFAMDLEKGDFMELPLAAKASGEFADGAVRIDALSGNLWIASVLQGRAKYDPAGGTADLLATVRVELGQSTLDADLSLGGILRGAKEVTMALQGNATGMRLAGYSAPSWPISLSGDGGAWTLQAGERKQIRASIDAQGAFSLTLADPLGIRGNMTGTIRDGSIDAATQDLFIDMPVLWRIFGQPFMEFPSGTVTASLEAKGNLRDPELSGRAMARNMSIRLPDFLKDTYGPVSLPLEIASNRLQARGISISDGGGTVLADLAIDFERWLPQAVMVDCRTAPEKPVRVDMVVGNIDAEGSAEGRLLVSVTPLRLELTGSFTASESTITLAPTREAEEQPSDWPILASVSVSVGRKVEFVWPSRQVPWLRTYLEPKSKLHVGLDSRTGDFSLKGDARLRGGEVFYFRRSFYVREGLMSFNENENSFDPFITIRADMRDQDAKGPVLITLLADRNRLSAFRPRLSSSPPKTEDEILALLGQAAIGGTGAEGQAAAVTEGLVSAAGDALAQFTGIRYFENTVRDTFNLDLFSVRSQLLQNVVLGAALADGGFGRTSLGNESSPGVYFDNTTIMAGKYLGSDLFLQGTVRMRNDPEAYLGNLDVNLEFSIEWNTPFFKILWDFFPRNAENLFVSDQSLGVFWEWTY